jgi:hypothetical protein
MTKFSMKRATARISHEGQFIEVPCLVAVDEDGVNTLAKIKVGDFVMCEVKKSRNILFHRKFFALVKLVYENLPEEMSDRFDNRDQFLDALKIAAGVTRPVPMASGKILYVPGSISFGKMDAIEFNEFYNNVADLICAKILPGWDSETLKAEVLDIVGG